MSDTFLYLSGLAGNAVTIWLAFWAIRRKYELDHKLDRTARFVRWSMVSIGFAVAFIGFAVALLPGNQLGVVRLSAGALLIAFLAWPNLAYHSTRLLRRWGFLPSSLTGAGDEETR